MSRKAKRARKGKKSTPSARSTPARPASPASTSPASRTRSVPPVTAAPGASPLAPGRKESRRAAPADTSRATATADAAEAADEPIVSRVADGVWLIGAALIVAGVGIYFRMDVNRVFDVPKAVVLKVGGCLLFAAWLVYATLGPGVRWRSARMFALPVAALSVAVMISTLLSFDVTTSFNGVYERQFGLQGFLACVGLFFLVATSLHGKRGAFLGLVFLGWMGSCIGIYAFFQALGMDPWRFFWNHPHNKVYAFLGNATFAGNALALIFPVVALTAGACAAVTISNGFQQARSFENRLLGTLENGFFWVLGIIATLAIQILPATLLALHFLSLKPVPAEPPRQLTVAFVFCVFVLVPLLLASAGLFGSWGPKSVRLPNASVRRRIDAFGAGSIAALAVGIIAGIVFTRTRGAWVGTTVAMFATLMLVPFLWNGTRYVQAARLACWGLAGASVLMVALFVSTPSTFCGPDYRQADAFDAYHQGRFGEKEVKRVARACWTGAITLRSIPAAFDSERTDFGKGQGTRWYLWTESPRVLTHHGATLDRYYEDRADYANHIDDQIAKGLGIRRLKPPSEQTEAADRAWRQATVWLFGIGIETYRYAFMSHKSKRLEALDPMTNHDNPHNNYLYVLASFGILGLLTYLWLLAALLWQSFKRFIVFPRALLTKTSAGHRGALVRSWRFEELDAQPQRRLRLWTRSPDRVGKAINAAQPQWRVELTPDEVWVSGFDPQRVLDELTEIQTIDGGNRFDRALALGIVASFFSYAVYSIAGFDSVACSVFLYFLLGCAAVLLRPSSDEKPDNLMSKIHRHWAEVRGKKHQPAPATTYRTAGIVLLVVLVPLLLVSAVRAIVVLRADQAFVHVEDPTEPRSPLLRLLEKIEQIKIAVSINPSESFYKQSLGGQYTTLSNYHRRRSIAARQQDLVALSESEAEKANAYRKLAENALYAALDHAWAPENIYISLFQLYYPHDSARAERALERALAHSPHLGAVRAYLASVQLDRGALDEALANARWVVEVDRRNPLAWQVSGRVYFEQGRLDKAEEHLKVAVLRSKGGDDKAARYLERIRRLREGSDEPAPPPARSATSSASPPRQ